VVDAIRDLLVLMIQMVMNALSVYLLKKYLNEKRRLQGSVTLATEVADRISNSDRRATFMAILMCLCSAFDHGFMFLCNIYAYFEFNLLVFILYTVANFLLPLRCCLDFALFFYFNKNFQRVFWGYVRQSGMLVRQMHESATSTRRIQPASER
jgi:hypothetical protein